MRKAQWYSPKGYSAPNEVVEVYEMKHGCYRIISTEGDGEKYQYWVAPSELMFIPEGKYQIKYIGNSYAVFFVTEDKKEYIATFETKAEAEDYVDHREGR